jgi:hypothetical protein
VNVVRISEYVFQTLNASQHAVTLPEAAGGGRMALFEAFHYLHCVVSNRATKITACSQQVSDRYGKQHTRSTTTKTTCMTEHINHCADMLRQKLMCDADQTMITYNWLKRHKSPHPNFNVQHQCRNYSALIETAKRNKVDTDMIPKRSDFEKGSLIDFTDPPFDPHADE